MYTVTKLHDSIFGNIPYIAPEILKAIKTKQDSHTKSSDIYSLGVLLWEISSGKTPFEDHNDYTIITAILLGVREEKIAYTPDEYYKLYSKCWDEEPKKRCTIEDVYEILEKLLNNNDEENVLKIKGKKKKIN